MWFSYETFVRLSQNCSAAFPLCRRNVDNQASLYLTVTALHVIHKSEENMYNLTYELEMFEECKTGHPLGLNSDWSLLKLAKRFGAALHYEASLS